MQFKTDTLSIYRFPCGPYATNAYVIVCEATREAAIIDPSPGSFQKIKKFAGEQGFSLLHVFLTHSHWDHIADTSLFVKEWNLPVSVHAEDVSNLVEPGIDQIPSFATIQSVSPSHIFQEGDVVSIGKSEWKIIHTPGHSPGGVCLYSEKEAILISGDTLFKGSCGRLDLPTGEPNRMWLSLKKLSQLSPNTVVFPGHGPSTTIKDEPWLESAEQLFG